jgi:quercetin dioxygenase-like cupin family protein
MMPGHDPSRVSVPACPLSARRGLMHKTATVDYIIVIKGEIWAIMDKGETSLKPGDVLVQRGTNHSWSVRGNEPCVIAAVLVTAEAVT